MYVQTHRHTYIYAWLSISPISLSSVFCKFTVLSPIQCHGLILFCLAVFITLSSGNEKPKMCLLLCLVLLQSHHCHCYPPSNHVGDHLGSNLVCWGVSPSPAREARFTFVRFFHPMLGSLQLTLLVRTVSSIHPGSEPHARL